MLENSFHINELFSNFGCLRMKKIIFAYSTTTLTTNVTTTNDTTTNDTSIATKSFPRTDSGLRVRSGHSHW